MASRLLQRTTLRLQNHTGPKTARHALQSHRARQIRVMASGADGAQNVLGGPLQLCCTDPMTGFNRDGYCRVTVGDYGVHAVCAQVTQEFLDFSASRGNDLSSVVKAGQKWCLCVSRWKEAKVAGKAPPVVLASTAKDSLQAITLDELKEHALDLEEVKA